MTNDEQDRHYKLLAMVAIGITIAVAFIYGEAVAGKGDHIKNAMAALLIAAAPFAAGGMLGFLFGIPKTLQAPDAPAPNGTVAHRHGWQANTNLEQVSDWLTKILIGVGLTQLQKIPPEVQNTGAYFADALGNNASDSVVTAMLVAFSVAGFVTAYLLTKFDLGRAIDREDGTLDALANAIIKNPNDREAVESFMLSSLYASAPDGFDKAIQSGSSFLSQEGHPQPQDGNVFAYLACAYGQKYAFQVAEKAAQGEQDTTKAAVLANIKAAISRDPNWTAKFRQLMAAPVGSTDNDLAALKGDKDLESLLDVQ